MGKLAEHFVVILSELLSYSVRLNEYKGINFKKYKKLYYSKNMKFI